MLPEHPRKGEPEGIADPANPPPTFRMPICGKNQKESPRIFQGLHPFFRTVHGLKNLPVCGQAISRVSDPQAAFSCLT
jgi:hypothetical protein